MRLTFTKRHHLVTEKYGHLDVEATVELGPEDDYPGMDITVDANKILDRTIEPVLERINRSLDQPGDDEFVRAYINSREV